MKKINYYLGTLALAAMTLASCSSDEPMKGQEPEKVLTDQTQYLAVSLCNPVSMGRATEFQDGAASESAVNVLVFVFYDGQGNPTATMKTISGNDVTSGWTEDYDKDNVTRIWTSVVPVEMTQGQEVPSYVMCFVNPINTTGLSTMTLKEVEQVERTRIKNGTPERFTMSNSVYYGDNPISGQSNVRMMATPIKTGTLYKKESDALAAIAAGSGKPVLDIYVERQAAKIGLTLAPNTISTYAVNVMAADGTSTAGTLTFTPEFWRPNAIDEHTFVCKAFATGTVGTTIDPTTPATYDEMNTAFQNTGMAISGTGTNPWNDPDNFRSYWACSPSYYANSYPRVSDNITDVANWNTTAYPYALRYFTYNQIKNGIEGTETVAPADKGKAWDATNGFTVVAGTQTTPASGYFYSRETTASIDNIKSTTLNNKAVVASAVIVGHYQLTGATGAPTDFYLYGKKDSKDNYYGTLAMLKNEMIDNQSVIFYDNQGTNLVDNADLFEVVHPAAAVRTGENVPGRLVTLQLRGVPAGDAVYFYDGTAFVAVDEDNIAAANKLLWKSVSTASMFNSGLAFFSIPIRHLGYGINVDENKPLTPVVTDATAGTNEANANVYNWQNMRRGDFGVVRNHVYTLNVRQIKGLGVGMSSPDQPIVPPMDPDNYYIAARLNILAWRVVPAQGVDL